MAAMRIPDMPNRLSRHAAMPCVVLLMLLCCATPARAQEFDFDLPKEVLKNPDRWLTDHRWGELRYGLTAREPHDALRILDTPQGDVIRWALADGTRISLSFARGRYEGVAYDAKTKTQAVVYMPAKIDVIKKQLGDELRVAIAGTVINTFADQVIEVGDEGELIGVINYFIIKPKQNEVAPYLFGTALLQLDDMSVAVVRLEAKQANLLSAISTFECLVHSIRVEEAKAVNRRLYEWYSNSNELLATLTQQDRLDAMKDDRLYRVLEGGRDFGYVRIWQRYQDAGFYKQLIEKDVAAGGEGVLRGINRFKVQGNAFVMQSHFEGQGATIEKLVEAVDEVGKNKTNGYWQIKNALSYKNDPGNRRAGTWVETGIRGIAMIAGERMDHMRVIREGTPPRHMVDFLLERERDPARMLRYPSADPRSFPAGDLKEVNFPTPKAAFLSFVDAELMPAMLPRDEKTYAFSAYDPETSRVDTRLMRVVPNADGGKTVYLRPVLDKSEQTLVFDRNNELVSRTYVDGRELRRTTRDELARIWGVRLRDR